MNSVWNKEELTDWWKEPVIVPVCKKGDTMDCSNYRDITIETYHYRDISL